MCLDGWGYMSGKKHKYIITLVLFSCYIINNMDWLNYPNLYQLVHAFRSMLIWKFDVIMRCIIRTFFDIVCIMHWKSSALPLLETLFLCLVLQIYGKIVAAYCWILKTSATSLKIPSSMKRWTSSDHSMSQIDALIKLSTFFLFSSVSSLTLILIIMCMWGKLPASDWYLSLANIASIGTYGHEGLS